MKPEHAALRYGIEPYRSTNSINPMRAENCQGDIYLGNAYDLQVWRNADKNAGSVWGYILIDPDKRAMRKDHSFTMFHVDAAGNIQLVDDDVTVTTGHLAEIYRCVGDHMASDDYDPTLHIDTDEEKD